VNVGLPTISGATQSDSKNSRPIGRVSAFLAQEGLLVVVGGLFAIAYVAHFSMLGDSWYTLLSGDLVVHHGFPSHDALTAWTSGRRWVDQQWLAQLATFAFYRIGRFRAIAFAYALFAVGSYAGSMAAARVGGASARSIAWVAAIALVPFYIVAADPRAQTMAFLFFIILLVLLRSPRALEARRVLLTLALIAVWANVHGSVVLGAALATARGAIELVRRDEIRRRTAAALFVLPWPLLLASPYGLHLVGYYRRILLGSGFSRLVVEWAPTTLKLETAPLYVLAFGAVWALGALRRRIDPFDSITLVSLLVMSFLALRNMGWFALAAMMILPGMLDELRPESRRVDQRMARLNTVLGAGILVFLVALTSSALASVDRKVEKAYPAAAARAVAGAARCSPTTRVFADVSYSDWLLWSQPSLRGKVAFDARYELLRVSELENAQRILLRVDGWEQLAGRFDVFVLDPRTEGSLQRALSARLRFEPLYRGSTVVVLGRRIARRCGV
jgi:hypothetical protein